MEYDAYLESLQQRLFSQQPRSSDLWQNDVWEGVFRPQVATAQRKELLKHFDVELLTDIGKTMRDAIRLDMFGIKPDGKRLHGVPDSPDASHRKLLPDLDTITPEEAKEAVDLLLVQSSYKLHKWGTATQLKEFADLCETIPDVHLASYQHTISAGMGISAQAAAVMHCDIATKPNFAYLQHRVRLLKSVSNVAERMWELLLKGAE